MEGRFFSTGDFTPDINTSYQNMNTDNNDSLDAPEEIITLQKSTDGGKLQFTEKDIERAKEWSEKSLMAIIYPVNTLDELEKLYDDFMLMGYTRKKKSNDACINFFGMTNYDLYEFLKEKLKGSDHGEANFVVAESTREDDFALPFYQRYMKSIYKEDNLDIAYTASSLLYNDNGQFNERIVGNCISDVIDNRKEEVDGIEVSPDIPTDCPMFTPEEMIDFGVFADVDADNYFGVQPDNTILEDLTSVKEWFEKYKSGFYGYDDRFTESSRIWLNTVRDLCNGLEKIKEEGNPILIKARKQSILELGWNPEVPFSETNRSYAYNRINSIAKQESSNVYRIADITAMTPMNEASEDKIEENEKDLHPIFVGLISGDNPFSAVIKAGTQSIYSHAVLSFDPKLENLYSFGIAKKDLASKSNKYGGFTIESIKRYPKDMQVCFYTFFVKAKDFVNIKRLVERYIDHPEDTNYSFKNIFTLIFHIPHQEENNMICSQFVDRMLKLADIDITHKNSSFVTPADFKRRIENTKINKKGTIFKVFEDKVSQFKSSNFIRKINTLLKKATPIKEMAIRDDRAFLEATIKNIHDINTLRYLSANLGCVRDQKIRDIYENFINPVLDVQAIGEAKSFPIEFDDKGNLILRNIWNIDIEKEYNASHTVLMNCSEKNLDAMKYELAKLWMLNLIAEKKMKKRPDSVDVIGLRNSRARILNDFNKYLKIVMKHDPGFVFSKYFEESPFNAAAVKISGDTLKYSGILLKRIISGATNDFTKWIG